MPLPPSWAIHCRSVPGKHIKKWILYHRIHKYTMFAVKWNPTQFKLDINLQTYQETDGTLAYLKGHTVRKLISLMKYMNLLTCKDRPDAQKHNLLSFISGNQLFELTAHDMKNALVKGVLENHGSQKYSSKRVKMVKTKPTDTPSKVPNAIQTLVLIPMTLQSQYQPLFKLLSSRKVSNQMNHLQMWLHPI